ncbi:uncharacterized protein B0H64DRAFT_449238 [Chaetomium fimeti]|uniref:RING-type domain-containing protein n=1 Tax=Chaetomium fimeti TaxID=1854472 RepID=A0AAE0LXX9_9PEZI|nr:hypothetical protein B0H64DRAFT_449238 [Chaetomium fimeti]
MCIKLIRHYECSSTVKHVCEYIIRCSNPTYMVEDLGEIMYVPGRRRRPCLDKGTLDTREEWYDDQACPDCTGENVAPETPCTRAREHTGGDDYNPHVYFEEADEIEDDSDSDDDAFYAYEVEDDNAISVYAQNLAFWLLAYMHSPSNPFDYINPLPGTPMGDTDNPRVMAERRMYVLNELLCPVHPEHGCLCKLDLDREALAAGRREFGHQPPAVGCSCLAAQKPWLSNWAAHIRREKARSLYFELVKSENGADLEIAYGLQERIFAQCAALVKRAAAAKEESSPEALPVLEILQLPSDAIADRRRVLRKDAKLMVSLCEREHHEERHERHDEDSWNRLQGRASLLPWVNFILAHDSGLTLRRAREILGFFTTRVVRYKRKWREFKPRILDYDACERLRVVASERPNDVCYWARETLGPYVKSTDFDTKLGKDYVDWQLEDRTRASIVSRNMTKASDEKFEALKESGDTQCPICLEDFETKPVQNWRCYQRGHRHWVHAPCLVKFGRTLLDRNRDDVAPAPRCPICRTEFEDFTLEEIAAL